MVPVRYSSIFKSRWIALLWAGGIVWSAVEYVGDQPDGNANNTADNVTAVSDQDASQVQAAVNAIDGIK